MRKIVTVILLAGVICLAVIIINGYKEYEVEESIREDLMKSAELYNSVRDEKAGDNSGDSETAPEYQYKEYSAGELGLGMEEPERFEIPEEELPFDIAYAEVKE